MKKWCNNLSTNILDKEFQAMMSPLNLMLTICFQPKFRIVDGSIVKNGFNSTVICLLGTCFILFVRASTVIDASNNIRSNLSQFRFMASCFDASHCCIYFILQWISNFSQAKQNIELVIKMQQVYQLFNSKTVLRACRKHNWISLILWLITCLSFVACNIAIGNISIWLMFICISLMLFDVNILYVTRIIDFLTCELKLWRLEVKRFQKMCSETNHRRLREYLKGVTQREKSLYKAYLDILDAFKLCNELFHKIIFMYAVEIFVHNFVHIQILLEMNKAENIILDMNIKASLKAKLFFVWVAKNFMLLCCLCTCCQRFYLALTDVERTGCVICSDSGCLVAVRRLCKKVARVNASSNVRQGMRACGVFTVNAAFPLRLLQLLATYTIVVLQFAFQ